MANKGCQGFLKRNKYTAEARTVPCALRSPERRPGPCRWHGASEESESGVWLFTERMGQLRRLGGCR